MKKVLDYLKRLDFSEFEAKLYIILLKTGSMTVAELAQKADINRTATYAYTNRLLQKGLIAKVQGSSSRLVANPPEHLLYLIEQKLTNVYALKESLPYIVNSINLNLPQEKTPIDSEIKYFKGRTGIKAVYKEALLAQEIRSYFSLVAIENILPENYKLFDNAIEQNPKMIIYELCEDSPLARKRMDTKFSDKQHVHKFLPSDIQLTANDILIYSGKVAIINLYGKHDMHAVVMSNKDYYNNSKQIFDLLWRLLPKPIILKGE